MSTEQHYGFLWLQALQLSERAERLHRQFLRYLGPSKEALTWEPPVDVQETEDGFALSFALPGVDSEDIAVSLEDGVLQVSAERRITLVNPNAQIRRLELPYGRFTRRLALPCTPLTLAGSRYRNGCLEVSLIRARRT